ncbi:hypothetical protein [Bacteroides pyogenes]|uniref:hypothetical protein n=1 Tax=Bacteroides pyogenes TaxID=310300 RepID=UPI001652C309|nr:hypothetical protein [Bacteroides pyogenes]
MPERVNRDVRNEGCANFAEEANAADDRQIEGRHNMYIEGVQFPIGETKVSQVGK